QRSTWRLSRSASLSFPSMTWTNMRPSLFEASALRLQSLGPLRFDEGPRVRTFTPKPSDIQRAWHVVDADGLVLGRMATEVPRVLCGKHKPTFARHVDTGDHVIIAN